MIVMIVLLLAVAIAIGVVLLGKDAPPPVAPSISALPATTNDSTSASRAAETPAARSTSQSATNDSAEAADAPAQPGATPGAGFAELFAAGARKADSKAPAAGGRFDPANTKAALSSAAAQALTCKENAGPTGKVTVVVTFEPSGKASSATIAEPAFAGTATGTCIISRMKRATIAPFTGLPASASKTFFIP